MTERIGNITLDYKHYPGEDLYCDGVVEDELLEIVRNHPASEYGRIIEERGSWPVLYHLSPLRGNIVEWISVDKGMKVLEVGSGCGAITGTLAKKAGELTCIDLSKKRSTINAYRHKECDNVTIHVGNFQDIEPELSDDYDYIFLIGVFEYGQGYIGTERPYEQFMNILKKHLKPDGRMVIAIENKFGLKYWAGCREDHLGTYFSGLEDYPEGGGVRTFTRKGLEKICAAAGIGEYSFYYPYPDYKFMTSVYSDYCLPKVGELSSNLRNFDRDRMLLFDEKNVFDTIIREEEFPLYSNSYLMVIGRDLNIKYAKYSNDRAPQFAVRTDIYEEADGARYVKKVPMTESAGVHVANILAGAQKLEEKYAGSRLLINRCEAAPDGVFLEYLYGRTLEELLDERLDCGDHRGFQDLVDEFLKAVSWRDNLPVTDYDLIFANIMVDGDRWTILDYEWTFDQPYSGRGTTLRSLYYYMMGAGKRMAWSLAYMKERLGCSDADIQKIAAQEAQFQKKVTGNRLSMQQMRDRIGCAVLRVTDLEAQQAGKRSKRKVQIYTDCGEGFSEETSYFVPGAYAREHNESDENTITIEIKLEEAVKAVRIDPAMESCLLTVRRMELQRENGGVRNISLKDCMLNGDLISGNAAVFATQDPNLTVDLSSLKGNGGMCILTAELGIVSVPESMAAEVGKGLENHGAGRDGAGKKTWFGSRKPGKKG